MKAKEHYGFNEQYKIHQCCSNRKAEIEMRPFVGYCVFMDGYVYATDTHILVRATLTKISNLSQVHEITNAEFSAIERSRAPHKPIVSTQIDGKWRLLYQEDAERIGLTDCQ